MPALKTTITAREIGKAIAKAIHEHKVLPGTKLGEDELSEIYGVSRTLVRSALQGLSHEQLVDIQPNRGAFVSKPSLREAREIFEARALLEPRTARLWRRADEPGRAFCAAAQTRTGPGSSGLNR